MRRNPILFAAYTLVFTILGFLLFPAMNSNELEGFAFSIQNDKSPPSHTTSSTPSSLSEEYEYYIKYSKPCPYLSSTFGLVVADEEMALALGKTVISFVFKDCDIASSIFSVEYDNKNEIWKVLCEIESKWVSESTYRLGSGLVVHIKKNGGEVVYIRGYI